MSLQAEAEENLRVIRSLMERATVYRAISVPTAFLAGALSVGAGLAMAFFPGFSPAAFRVVWWGAALVVALANTILLQRERSRAGRDTPFFNPGLAAAVRAAAPALVAGGLVPVLAGSEAFPTAVWWTIFYGLALLSMSHFAPGGIIRLGLAFLAAGLLSIWRPDALGGLARAVSSEAGGLEPDSEVLANLYMAATFGLFHLAYAAAVAFAARRAFSRVDV